ncbi:MAG: M23 family metallopeptidase, partial [Pseudomonadota bacterium]|nr:M23 family metallopeptidase [Pseudomonadota bacterium]
GELLVKRGERVRRGQVIAKSGQTGNVTSPQLHFELRKGQAAVDPIPHLNGG